MAENLPISTVVDVTITSTPVAPSAPGFGTLLIITSDTSGPLDGTNRTKEYGDINSVIADWTDVSEVSAMATTWFSQNPKPLKLVVGFWDKLNASPEAIGDALSAIEAENNDWYFISVEKTTRDDADAESIAAYAEARIKIFGTTSNSADVLDDAIDTDIASVLQAASYRRSFVVYSSSVDDYPEVSVMARAATVNFDAPNSTITLKFKLLPGITVEQLTTGQKTALDGKNGNAYINVGGAPMYAESFMASGVFFDEVHGIDWLQAEIENRVFARLYTEPTKIPYTDKGAAILEQQVINSLNASVVNGLVAPGTDQDGNFLDRGFVTSVIPVADVSQADKDARKGPTISFTALLAGAIHSIQINGVVLR